MKEPSKRTTLDSGFENKVQECFVKSKHCLEDLYTNVDLSDIVKFCFVCSIYEGRRDFSSRSKHNQKAVIGYSDVLCIIKKRYIAKRSIIGCTLNSDSSPRTVKGLSVHDHHKQAKVNETHLIYNSGEQQKATVSDPLTLPGITLLTILKPSNLTHTRTILRFSAAEC